MKQSIITGLLLSGLILPTGLMAQAVTEEWVATYNDSVGDADSHVAAITIDSAENVYVTGSSGRLVSGRTNWNYATVKYDSDGNELWVAKFSSPGTRSYARAIDLAVDRSGNVYVTGRALPDADGSSELDYVTVKYDANGDELWAAWYDGPQNGEDYPIGIAVDASGNVYVTGNSFAFRDDEDTIDLATIKYDGNGNQIWVARYADCELDTYRSTIAVDALENVYVACSGITDGNYVTVRYDIGGNQLWAATHVAQGLPVNLALDAYGNVYVTGFGNIPPDPGSETDYVTVKYDPNGFELWTASYDRPGDNFDSDRAKAIAVDPSGNVYVAGASRLTFRDYEYATVKYDTDGNEQWVAKYIGPANGRNEPTAIGLDGSGNVYVTGRSPNTAGNTDYATVSYDTNGNERWVARYVGAGGGSDNGEDIAVAPSGNVYVTGSSHGTDEGGKTEKIVYSNIATDTEWFRNASFQTVWDDLHLDGGGLLKGLTLIASNSRPRPQPGSLIRIEFRSFNTFGSPEGPLIGAVTIDFRNSSYSIGRTEIVANDLEGLGIMLPPDESIAMGVFFDDPTTSMGVLTFNPPTVGTSTDTAWVGSNRPAPISCGPPRPCNFGLALRTTIANEGIKYATIKYSQCLAPPTVTAALQPIGEVEEDEGRFRVVFAGSDLCDDNLTVTATLNDIPVSHGQVVRLEVDDEVEATYRRGRLRALEAPGFRLVATATNSAGSVATAEAEPLFVDDDD